MYPLFRMVSANWKTWKGSISFIHCFTFLVHHSMHLMCGSHLQISVILFHLLVRIETDRSLYLFCILFTIVASTTILSWCWNVGMEMIVHYIHIYIHIHNGISNVHKYQKTIAKHMFTKYKHVFVCKMQEKKCSCSQNALTNPYSEIVALGRTIFLQPVFYFSFI